jgi:hypothetical protein
MGAAYCVDFGKVRDYFELYPSFFVSAEPVQRPPEDGHAALPFQSERGVLLFGVDLKQLSAQVERHNPLAEERKQKAVRGI